MKKKIKLGLFPKVVIAITLGAVLGLFLPDVFIRIFKTFNVLFAQLLKFSVPLLVLGLVTPAVANLGKGAGKMLVATGDGVLSIEKLIPEGKKEMAAGDFVRGRGAAEGDAFEF